MTKLRASIRVRGKLHGRTLKTLSDFWLRYKRNKLAVIGFYTLVLLSITALLAPILAPYDPFEMNLNPNNRFLPPSPEHPFGTDHLGRDILSRIIWGTRISLFVGFVSAGISAIIGILVGSISGYYGGLIDDIIMRVVDVFLVIPTFFLILLIIALFGSSIWNMMLVIGLTIWPSTARLVRAEFLSLKSEDFVEAERALGAKNLRIIFKCILPNAIYPAIVNASLQVAAAILAEAALSFLGLGDPTQVSWGKMLYDAREYLRGSWWMATFPGIFISIAVLAFNLIGDGLNDALNPRLRRG